MIVLDTHVLLWVVNDERKLGRKSRALIDKFWPIGQVAVPAISFWELGHLQARRRVQLTEPVRDWRVNLLESGFVELPLDGAIAVRALELIGLPEDPADRFIVATALIHNASLVTADQRLLDWQHAFERHDARL